MGRSSEVNRQVKEERRGKILAGALELFALNGFSGTKISDIARHTGMSNGLVYHYFSSKDDIFTELIRIAFERMIAACRHLAAMELQPHQKIRYAIDELVKTIRYQPGAGLNHLLVAQATASNNVPPGVKEILCNNHRIPYRTIEDILSQGQEAGTVREGDAEDLAFFFWNTINGIALHQVMYGDTAQSPSLTPLYHMFFTSEESDTNG